MAGSRRGPKKRRRPRKASAAYLERVALWYLERYAATSASLRRVLDRRVEKSVREHGTDRSEGRDLVQDIIGRFERSGLLDDRRFAESRARSLHERGISVRMIRSRLMAKGIAPDIIDDALQSLGDDIGDLNMAAAVRYARRRRLGVYRNPESRAERREKDLAAMARAGFGYDTARRIVDAEDTDDVDGFV
ncbi:MAG: regulatory protein RecX [Rhodospirillales bacterium]